MLSPRETLIGLLTAWLLIFAHAYRYDPDLVDYNLNQNQLALSPTEYSGSWPNHDFTASPDNWRFPFYTILLDRFVNGDCTNDDINGTYFEHDIRSNQMRHGGDVVGLQNSLDYIQGMGIKGLYLAGSAFMNLPWSYDQYSPVDLTLLDQHLGTITQWRVLIEDIHSRGMYVVLDNTFATLGDLIGFDGYLNQSTPFNVLEYQVIYKTSRQYYDFHFGEDYNETCQYPRFYNETGYLVDPFVTAMFQGCMNSEFDQYGDTEAFGVYPDYRRELTKFASAQDRLREWYTPTRLKLQTFYCMLISQLDVDGFRFDKATQSTVDALGDFGDAIRQCARRYGKNNLFLPGEITGGNTFGSVYLGRGRQPDQQLASIFDAMNMTNQSLDQTTIRAPGNQALDAAAFHYTAYRALERFLGLDGNLEAAYDAPINWVDMWNTFLVTNDLVNAETMQFDPRHMFGVTNQDVFRWPAIINGTQRQLLGHFVTTLLMPGIPLIYYGEEQAFYVLDNTAENYVFGRQAMSSATAWQDHGCYSLPSAQYYQWPIGAARYGCHDDTQSHDHRDPSAPVRNILKHMFSLRESYPVLTDGFFLQQLSNQTESVYYPGSSGVPTETGMWSIVRSGIPGVQNFTTNQVWLLMSNVNSSQTFSFNCQDKTSTSNNQALIAPFSSGTRLRNLLAPYDEVTLEDSAISLGLDGSSEQNGCLSTLQMSQYDFRAYVPSDEWQGPRPMITKSTPAHDARLLSTLMDANGIETVPISFEFSAPMSCDSITRTISLTSAVNSQRVPQIQDGSVTCGSVSNSTVPLLVGAVPSVFFWSATLENVENGIHSITVTNASNADGTMFTNAVDRFLFRIGQPNNPMVFPRTGNYSQTLVTYDSNGDLAISHAALGADLWRYSTNWGTSYTYWMPYAGGVTPISMAPWNGTTSQQWSGTHVKVQYWSQLAGSSDHVQEGDLDPYRPARRFPHLFLEGPFNQYGYDAGPRNVISQTGPSTWQFYFNTEWPAIAQVNVWGINPDQQPDETYVMGDIDGDSVLDRLPPFELSPALINITEPPQSPNVGWLLTINDATYRFELQPAGHSKNQIILYILLWVIPPISGALSVWLFVKSFYGVKFEKFGLVQRASALSVLLPKSLKSKQLVTELDIESLANVEEKKQNFLQSSVQLVQPDAIERRESHSPRSRRMVLIATMEYDIEDWEIKVKIGGLGVMAQLMGKHLGHQDLIWVVPCVGGIEYPAADQAEQMTVKILGKSYAVRVQYHRLRNITYVLLDAPTFRQQSKAEPYPARMDDLGSAIYYSAWNQCIAQAIERFQPDLYHINDYHGCVAPLYLLPTTIPVCLSLHNAEFQGLWPMKSRQECEEIAGVFNIPSVFVQQFVQFGEVFNLLHAGASYLRVYQQGFGAVGVSRKYGTRSFLRYPIFWGLKKVGQLPNPDPSDTGAWDKKLPREEDIVVDPGFENKRPQLKLQAQEWAGLNKDPNAELFVYVGRWSTQKGVDLIADVFPAVLEAHQNAQLICVGPVIDLYGKFAAAKLSQMMELYPGRVFSKPEFTALPPFIFSGAEFALIPSRDEPFGLVAVEFGRKGALGVGARVGGLGQMPGWWYTVESMQTSHLLEQFKSAIDEAIRSKQSTRIKMRARSAKQRFPVAQWVEDLDILQSTAIKVHAKKTYEALEANEKKIPRIKKRLQKRGRHLRKRKTLTGDGTGTPMPYSDPYPSECSSIASDADEPRMIESQLYSDDDSDTYDLTATDPTTDDEMSIATSAVIREIDRNQVITINVEDVDAKLGQLVESNRSRPSLHRAASYSDDRGGSLLVESTEHSGPSTPDIFTRIQREPDEWEIARAERLFNEDESSATSTHESSEHAELSQARAVSIVREFRRQSLLTGDPILKRNLLSGDKVLGSRTNYKLQKVDPFFTDPTSQYYEDFKQKLQGLKGSNSESRLCIEEYLIKSEKKFFGDYRNAKLGYARHSKGPASIKAHYPSGSTLADDRQSVIAQQHLVNEAEANRGFEAEPQPVLNSMNDPWALGHDYQPPSGLKRWMQIRIGDWPVYAFFLALGQIIAANSYQIILLTGQVGQNANEVYVTCSVYMVASLAWWLIFRTTGSRAVLSWPFFFYGLAFLFVATSRYAAEGTPRSWMNHFSGAFYAIASASGTFFFVLNFGDEGGSQVRSWVFRAWAIQGTQQFYVVILWFWGAHVNINSDGHASGALAFASSPIMTAIALPLAFVLWALGALLWYSLPEYYRQVPGVVPDFYRSVWRRKIIIWFFLTVLIQNFFLSPQYGRSWGFLFSSSHVLWWQVIILVFFFFVLVWAAFMWGFSILTHSHTWILPIFAIGLGAPRWAQIWWATSGTGLWLPWAPGGYIGSALISRALWLWLGVLDVVQGVGLGMILLTTLTRLHVLFTLAVAQVLGAMTTAFARAVAPDRLGPGSVFPDITEGASSIANAWFWIGLLLNVATCIGYFKFFRKEQLTKP